MLVGGGIGEFDTLGVDVRMEEDVVVVEVVDVDTKSDSNWVGDGDESAVVEVAAAAAASMAAKFEGSVWPQSDCSVAAQASCAAVLPDWLEAAALHRLKFSSHRKVGIVFV